MTEDPGAHPQRDPILLCAGTRPAVAARLAETAVALLDGNCAVVMATWAPPTSAAAEQAVDAAATILSAHGGDVRRAVLEQRRSPWEAILDLADEVAAGVIVAGASEGAGPPGTLGREARGLAHRTRRPLLLAPPDGARPGATGPAVVASDGSDHARRAIDVAAQILRPRPAVIVSAWHSAAHAVGAAGLALPDEVARQGAARLDDEARDEAEANARAAAAQLEQAGWTCELDVRMTARSVPGAIIDAADDHDAAVIVIGTRGRSRVAAALLGSTADAVLRHAGRPVLLVPPG